MRLDELTGDDARAIAGWRYPPPYDCYDHPDWSRMVRDGWAICDPAARQDQFGALRADDGGDRDSGRDHGVEQLAGYVRFRPLPDAVMLHLGMRPDLCGRGLGRELVDRATAEARRRAGTRAVRLQVRRFNARATTVYWRAGFRLVRPDEAGGPEAGRDGQDLLTMELRQASVTRSR